MPFEIMDQRGVPASSYFHEEVFCTAEGQIEILKLNAVFDLQGSGVKVPSSNELVLPEDQLEKLGSVGEGFSMNSWMPVDSQQKAWSSFCVQPASHGLNGKTDASDIGCESSLFSSSLSELFSRKMRFMRNDVRSPQPANNVAFDNEEAELFESIEDIEAQTIGNLLPDENDLFSGVIDEVGQNSRGSSGDDIEDFDLFSSGGGMELEGDGMRNGQKGSNLFGQLDSARAKKLDSARAKTIGVQQPSHPIDGMGSGNNGISNLHPHSFPEYHDGFVLGSPYRIPGTFVEMVGNDMKMNGGFNTKTVAEAPPNGHHMGVHAGAFGSPRNGSIINGNHQMYPQQQPFPNPMIWPHSPSSINGVHAHRFPPVVAFPRAPTMILKAPSPVHHHIGSAPTVKPAFWDRRHAFIAESPDSSGFCLGSPSHPLDIAQHNIFAQVGGTRMDMSVNVGPRSPHFFGGRNSLMSMPASFDSPNERVRNFSHRRSDTVSNNADKKLYELDIDRILRGEDSRTTLMIKNIPNKYTSKMLLAAIDEYCKGTYDFIYLPIDFKNKCNVGYAFINMIDPDKIIPFHKALNGKKWEKFNSEKVASIAYARIQGKTALIAHFQNSSLMNEDKRCRPILFHTDGPNAGDQEPFPMGANIRARTGNPRAVNNGRNYGQGSSFSLPANKDETSNGADFSSKVL